MVGFPRYVEGLPVSRIFKVSLAWTLFSVAMFLAGWTGGKRSMQKIAEQNAPRFVVPRQKVSTNEAFNVGIECPSGYRMEFIALTPKEEKEFESKPNGGVVDEVMNEEKRTNKLLNNAVCVKGAQ
jgi:hypothetical protein